MRDSKGRFVKGGNEHYKKVCVRCGNLFVATSSNSKYCPTCKEEMSFCEWCGKRKKSIYSRFCSNSCAGKWKYAHSLKVKKALAKGLGVAHIHASERAKAFMLGRPRPELRREKNPNWKGGTHQERHNNMGRVEYKNWRRKVFERDNYTCQICGKKGVVLNAHHIRAWQDYPSLRYFVPNGMTLCKSCHVELHKHANETLQEYFNPFIEGVANAIQV